MTVPDKLPVDVSNVKPVAPIESPLKVYASKVGSFANVVPCKPKSRLTVAPLAYGLPANVPDEVCQVTFVSMKG